MVLPINVSRKVNRLADAHCFRREVEVRRGLQEQITSEVVRQQIEAELGISDPQLTNRIQEAGFSAHNISALSLVPVAFVAWGSGTVTNREFRTAIDAIYFSALPGKSSAITLFRSWLKYRPSQKLMSLWEDVTGEALKHVPDTERLVCGERLYLQCERVALASGGLLGFGRICEGERLILDRIHAAYRLGEDLVN